MIPTSYESTANALVNRILALIPEQPQILQLESAWDLFKVPGFKCDDIGPSLAQASWALSAAKQAYTASQEPR